MNFALDISITPADLTAGLETDIQAATRRLLKELAPEIEQSVKRAVDNPSPSSRGNAPGKRSGELYDSPQATAFDDYIELQLAEHAFYLDPIFEGQGKGGGWANRPFIAPSIDDALGAVMQKSL